MHSIPGNTVVREFEYKIAENCNSEFALSVCNATIGIMGVFYALGLQNCEVITTPLTWPGAISGLLALNCKIRFCDVEPGTLTIDPENLKKLITPDTKAVFSADFLGYPARLDLVKEICETYKVWLIHDAASSFGTRYNGYYSGYYADVAILSFGKNKLFTIGEGGCVVTNKKEVYEQLLHTMSHPEKQQIETGLINPFAFNTRISPLAAEYGCNNFQVGINYIEKRAQKIRSWFEENEILPQQENIKPNYYKILLNNEIISSIPGYSEFQINELPFKHLIYDESLYQSFILRQKFNCPVAEGSLEDYSLVNIKDD